MDHLEKQAKEFKDREDLVPYTGEKRGTELCCASECVAECQLSAGSCVSLNVTESPTPRLCLATKTNKINA